MAPGVTDVSQAVSMACMTIFWICVVIGVAVFGAIGWSVFAYRRSRSSKAAWTFMRTPGWDSLDCGAVADSGDHGDSSDPHAGRYVAPANPQVDIQITGYRWKWHYKYLGQDVEFFSNLTP